MRIGQFYVFLFYSKSDDDDVKTYLIGEDSFHLLDVKGRLIESTKTCLSSIFAVPPLGGGVTTILMPSATLGLWPPVVPSDIILIAFGCELSRTDVICLMWN